MPRFKVRVSAIYEHEVIVDSADDLSAEDDAIDLVVNNTRFMAIPNPDVADLDILGVDEVE